MYPVIIQLPMNTNPTNKPGMNSAAPVG